MSLLPWFPTTEFKGPDDKIGLVSTTKILLVGDPGVGKTTLIQSYLDWKENNPFTMGTSKSTLDLDEYYTEFLFWDQIKSIVFYDIPEGEYELNYLRSCKHLNLDFIVFCFSLADPDTLASVWENWFQELPQDFGYIPRILLGLKSDIKKHNSVVEDKMDTDVHMVSDLEAIDIQSMCKMSDYMKCSAQTGEDIYNVISGIFYYT